MAANVPSMAPDGAANSLRNASIKGSHISEKPSAPPLVAFFAVRLIGNGQHIKKFAVGGDEPTILPDGVRKYEIEQASLFVHLLSFVECCGPLGEFEKPDTLIHVCLIRPLMLFDFV